jgi:hypothetical protein
MPQDVEEDKGRKMRTWFCGVMFLCLVLGLVACDDQSTDDSASNNGGESTEEERQAKAAMFGDLCVEQCQQYDSCYGDSDTEESCEESCADEVSQGMALLEIEGGEACLDAYNALGSCTTALSCEDLDLHDEGRNEDGEDFPCMPEYEVAFTACAAFEN